MDQAIETIEAPAEHDHGLAKIKHSMPTVDFTVITSADRSKNRRTSPLPTQITSGQARTIGS